MPLLYTPSPPAPSSSTTQRTQGTIQSQTTPNTSESIPLQIRDRRRRYLVLNPSYFDSPSLASTEPLLHYALIRRFQTPAEREAAARKTGLASALAAGVVAGESRAQQAQLDPVLDGERASTRDEGLQMWRTRMERRFVEGEDGDFDYATVDRDARYDDVDEETRRRQDEYFDGQQEEFVGEGGTEGQTGVQDY